MAINIINMHDIFEKRMLKGYQGRMCEYFKIYKYKFNMSRQTNV